MTQLPIWLLGRSHVLRPGACIYQPAGFRTRNASRLQSPRACWTSTRRPASPIVAAVGVLAATLALPPADHPEPDLERLAALAAEHDIELLGPPGSLP